MEELEKSPVPGEKIEALIASAEKEDAQILRALFIPFYEQAEEWRKKAESLVVVSASQKKEMKEARDARLLLKKIRSSVENERKRMKAGVNKKAKAIDGVASYLKGLIEPIEAHLSKQENFIEIQKEEAEKALLIERNARIHPDVLDFIPRYAPVATMSDEDFEALLESAEAQLQLRKDNAAAIAKAEELQREVNRREAEDRSKQKAEEEARIAAERLKDQQALEKTRQELQDARHAIKQKEEENERLKNIPLQENLTYGSVGVYESPTPTTDQEKIKMLKNDLINLQGKYMYTFASEPGFTIATELQGALKGLVDLIEGLTSEK